MINWKLLHVMFYPHKKMGMQFDTDYEMADRSNSQWAWISNANSLKKENITSSHISFTSPLYHRIQALPHFLQQIFYSSYLE